ncbi:MAG: acyl-ACP--UDP-N-acetylglucosamine O-acyltransferase [Nitrospiria bacterium]
MSIHQTAIVHSKAELDSSVEVGPYSIVGEHVRIGKGTRIGSHVVIDGWTEMGEDNRIYPFASIGLEPQDLKFNNEETQLKIGSGNTLREYITVHRGTGPGGGETIIGDESYLMAYVHVAHDCVVGNRVIMANAATLAGCISIGDHAILGGLVAVHQFVRIGSYAMIGGCSAVAQDVPPYVTVAGNHATLYGLNTVGLKRHGFSLEQIQVLKKTYKLLFRSGLTQREGIEEARKQWGSHPEVERFLAFVENSQRGICR